MLCQSKKKQKSTGQTNSFFYKKSSDDKISHQKHRFNTLQDQTVSKSIQSKSKYENQGQGNSSQNRHKGFSFIRVNPSTCKNFHYKNQLNVEPPEKTKHVKGHKEVKVPNFFRKKTSKQTQSQKQLSETALKTEKQNIQNKQKILQNVQRNGIHSIIKTNKNEPQSQLFEYKKLNDKLNYLQERIGNMKGLLDKKRKEKLDFFQNEKLQRASTFSTNDEDASTTSSSEAPLKQFVTQVPHHKGLHTFTKNPYSPRNCTYYVSEILRAYKQDKSLAREHLLSSIQYLRMFDFGTTPPKDSLSHLKLTLQYPKGYENKKTIIFDLDETLIHCNENVYTPSDIKIKVQFPTGEKIEVGINIRPYAQEIIASLSRNFQIIVFTASHSCYANVVLDYLDPDKKYIHHRIFRENCYCTPEGIYVKDLRILNRDLSKVVLVDNAAYSYAYQIDNGIPIIPYYEGKHDYELQALQKYVGSLHFAKDVRQKNRQTFKLHRYGQFDDHNTLVQKLYQLQHEGENLINSKHSSKF